MFTPPIFQVAAGIITLFAIIAVGIGLLPNGRFGLSKVPIAAMRDTASQLLLATPIAVAPSSSDRQPAGELAANQEIAAKAEVSWQDRLEGLLSDLAALRRQVQELASKQDQMAGTLRQDLSNTIAGDRAALRREVKELAAKQDGMTDDIARLQASERTLSQKLGNRPRSHRRSIRSED